MTDEASARPLQPFNGAVEIGLRALSLLNEAFPATYSLQRLVVFDYLVVHSDDLPNGPAGLHPKTPHRGGELLVRRAVLEEGLLLYQSRGLVELRRTASAHPGIFRHGAEQVALCHPRPDCRRAGLCPR